ncbi:MAG: VOC family protein [Acidimicrobiaceae bacterium]|nr:VOC family protein [Acidimicrobiaceae bacterium]
MADLHGLRTVIYSVTDVQSSRDWWKDFLGISPYFDEPFYIGFEVGGFELGLMPSETPTSEGALTYWGVDDVASTVEEACRNGAWVHVEPSDVGGGIVTATVRLPDQAIVGFIYNPHFASK